MKAFRMTGPGVAAVTEVPDVIAQAGEALLRVKMVGMCGTDLNTFRGRNAMVSFPRVPGHEVAAEVMEGGGALAAGTAVTISPYTSCGVCPSCRRGRVNACQFNETMGVQRDGAMTEYISVPVEKLYAAKLSTKELCLVEPLTVGFHAAARGQVTAEEIVAVFGCGRLHQRRFAGLRRLPSIWTTRSWRLRGRRGRSILSTRRMRTCMSGWLQLRAAAARMR